MIVRDCGRWTWVLNLLYFEVYYNGLSLDRFLALMPPVLMCLFNTMQTNKIKKLKQKQNKQKQGFTIRLWYKCFRCLLDFSLQRLAVVPNHITSVFPELSWGRLVAHQVLTSVKQRDDIEVVSGTDVRGPLDSPCMLSVNRW